MNARSICARFVLAISVFLAANCLWAQDGIEGALGRSTLASLLKFSTRFGRTLAAADFDKDHKLDGAVLIDSGRLHGQNGFRIELHLSGSGNTELTFESAETALAVTASDVNEDGATDVVVERPVTHERLYVWLNDGHGDFYKGRIEDFPSTGNAAREQLDAPFSGPDHPVACLGPQRGTETARLPACSLPEVSAAPGEIKPCSRSSLPTSSSFSVNPSRAPPLSL